MQKQTQSRWLAVKGLWLVSSAPHSSGWKQWARAKSRCWVTWRRTSSRRPSPLWTSAWTTRPWTPAWSATAHLPTTTMLCATLPRQYSPSPPGPTSTTTSTTPAAGNLSDGLQALLSSSRLTSHLWTGEGGKSARRFSQSHREKYQQ